MISAPRVLIIRLSSLGDVILTTPVPANIKAACPDSRITVLVKEAFAPVFEGNPDVDDVTRFEERGLWGWMAEIRRRRYDWILDLHDTPRSRLWCALSGAARRVRYDKRAWARRRLVATKTPSSTLAGTVVDRYVEVLPALGVPVVDRRPRLADWSARPDLRVRWAAETGTGPWLVAAPGAAHGTKRWGAERFAEASRRLARELRARIVLVGAPGDLAAGEAVKALLPEASVTIGRTGLADLFHLIGRASLLLTNDSGTMHVGDALGVPTVAVFGPTVEAFGFFPQGPRSRVVQAEGVDCRPCSLHGAERCPQGHFRCMGDVSVDSVLDAARAVLKRP
jgi:heptosyltransferase-2